MSGNSNFTQDIFVNSLTVGRGGGNVDSNTAFGNSALTGSGTIGGIDNTAVGKQALQVNSTGNYNTAIGFQALPLNTTGDSNTALGTGALYENKNGASNTAVGVHALQDNISGGSNTASGYVALQSNLANSNTAFGANALYFNTDGSNNTAIGDNAGSVGDASYNSYCTFLGYNTGNSAAAASNIKRTKSTAIGYNAVISSDNQIVLGTSDEGVYIPGDYLQIGSTSYKGKNSGGFALDVDGSANFTKDILVNGLTVGKGGNNDSQNTALGYNALVSNVGGTCNTAIGYVALEKNIGASLTTGRQNTAVGHYALNNNKYGNSNTAVGFDALTLNTGDSNTAVGDSALATNSTGNKNTAVGLGALYSNSTGIENTASGYWALYSTTGNNNTAFGVAALYSHMDGSSNTAIGWQAGNVNGYGATSVSYCTFLGANTGSNPATATWSNSTAIGYNSIITASNQIILGTSSEGVWLPGEYLKIGGTSYAAKGSYALDVNGSATFTQDIFVNSLTVGQGGGNATTNTAVGYQALLTNTPSAPDNGSDNTAVGYQALHLNQSGKYNTAVGCIALANVTSGQANTAVGMEALHFVESGGNSTAIGFESLYYNLATNNTATGYQALYSTTVGNENTAIGVLSLFNNTVGRTNTAIGFQSGYLNTLEPSGNINCTFLGAYTHVTPPGSYKSSTAIGYDAGINASYQIVLGTTTEGVYIPGDYLKIGGTYTSNNSGGYALDVYGSAIFTQDISVHGLTIGRGRFDVSSNTVVGYNSLYITSNASYNNTAVGFEALQNNNTGNGNTAVGLQALQSNGDGNSNTAVGCQALTSTNGTDGSNTAIGYSALFSVLSGGFNTALGANSGYKITTGAYNTSVGCASYGANADGSCNTAVGCFAGDYDSSGSFNTFLGYSAGGQINTGYQYSTALGYNSVFTASNQIILGTSNEGVYIPGDYLKIGGAYNNISGYALDVNGNANFTGTVSAASFNPPSDYRIKENVTKLNDTFIVDNLNPVTYTNTKTHKQDIGLIAHELQEHYPFLVNGTKDGKELQSVNYMGLIGILIKEIKVLKAEIGRLDANDNTIYEKLVAYINSKFTA